MFKASFLLGPILALAAFSPFAEERDNLQFELSDIPQHIIDGHVDDLNGHSAVSFIAKGLRKSTALSMEDLENMVRSEVLYFIIKRDDVTAADLFNELGMFDTYRKLIDGSPSSIWRDLTYQSTHPLFIHEQIERAYFHYQSELLSLSDFVIESSMPDIGVDFVPDNIGSTIFKN